jgi:hypothetical protein
MKLYHGSTVSVEIPDLQKCRPDTDFGQAFYTTTSFEQSAKWAKIKQRRASESTEKYDFVMGPVANDSLYATILLYEQGILTADAAIEQLKSHTLFDQLSFHTETALKNLKYLTTNPIVKPLKFANLI